MKDLSVRQFSDFINKLIQKISLIEHFNPFARGIIDSREICFFVLSFFSMILLSTAFQYRSSEKKIPVPALFFFCIFILNLYADSSNKDKSSLLPSIFTSILSNRAYFSTNGLNFSLPLLDRQL